MNNTFKPAHKQDDPDKAPGQIVNRPEESFDRYPYLKHSTADQTLGDYIARKNYHDAFDRVAEEMGLKKKTEKLTWGQWYLKYSQEHPEMFNGDDTDAYVVMALQQCWKVAQENV